MLDRVSDGDTRLCLTRNCPAQPGGRSAPPSGYAGTEVGAHAPNCTRVARDGHVVGRIHQSRFLSTESPTFLLGATHGDDNGRSRRHTQTDGHHRHAHLYGTSVDAQTHVHVDARTPHTPHTRAPPGKRVLGWLSPLLGTILTFNHDRWILRSAVLFAEIFCRLLRGGEGRAVGAGPGGLMRLPPSQGRNPVT